MNPGIRENASKLNSVFMRISASRGASWLLLGAFFWIVASAGFSGFIGKWGLSGTAEHPAAEERFGLPIMLDGTAHKPFVYRQFAPLIAKGLEKILPEKIKGYACRRLLPKPQLEHMYSPPAPELRFQHLVVYYLSFFSLFLSLFILRRVLLDLGIGNLVAVLAPVSLILALPYIQTVGGFFYDNIEIFFLSTAFLLAGRGWAWSLIALALPAALNKETFIFFVPALYPLLRHHLSVKFSALAAGGAILAAGLVNVAVKFAFFHSERGGVAELHVLKNLKFYLNPLNYVQFNEVTYGVMGPKGFYFGTILVIAVLIARSWPSAPNRVRWHLLIVSAINFPLVLIFCAPGELRNLSLVYVGLTVMIAYALDRGGKRAVIP
ncbi:MAG: hypothetical protein RLZZ214_4026 [Verrucomicrobiota bacterium]|jgi:hypothetical protein